MYMSTNVIDVHLHRDPYEDKIWNDTKKIMTKAFSPDEIARFEEYKQKFVAML